MSSKVFLVSFPEGADGYAPAAGLVTARTEREAAEKFVLSHFYPERKIQAFTTEVLVSRYESGQLPKRYEVVLTCRICTTGKLLEDTNRG